MARYPSPVPSPWLELGDGVFAARYRFYDQQIGLVVGGEHVLVIDTRTTHGQAGELVADVRRITDRPIDLVVNTHAHYDHCFGNRVLRPAAIWGHARGASELVRTGERQRARVTAELPELADELAEVELDPPDRTFESAQALELGDRVVELRYLGRGHTNSDIVVRVPDARVTFAGDLLENGAPPAYGDAFPLDWPATVAALAAILDGAVVPGHGDVADRAFAERQQGEIAAIAEAARAIEDGETTLEIAARAHPWGAEAARRALERALAQLRGELD